MNQFSKTRMTLPFILLFATHVIISNMCLASAMKNEIGAKMSHNMEHNFPVHICGSMLKILILLVLSLFLVTRDILVIMSMFMQTPMLIPFISNLMQQQLHPQNQHKHDFLPTQIILQERNPVPLLKLLKTKI
jgi:hypothetical protein